MAQLPDTVEELVLVSDNCSGQNRNLNVLTCCLVAVQVLPIKRIHQFFLERGHTQMDVDNVHARIEIAARKDKGNLGIHGPSDWVRIIQTAAKSHPTQVHTLRHHDIIAWKTVANDLVTNRKILSNGESLAFNKVKWFGYNKERPGEVTVAYGIGPTQQLLTLAVNERVETNRQREERRLQYAFPSPTDLERLLHQREYSQRLPISKAKYKDLQEICSKGFVSAEWHSYYRFLPTTEEESAKENETEEDCYSSSGTEFDSGCWSYPEEKRTGSMEDDSSSCSSCSDEDTD